MEEQELFKGLVPFKTLSTPAILIVPESSIIDCKEDFPGWVFTEYTDGSKNYFISAGFMFNHEIDYIVNEATWQKKVKFGELSSVLADSNLVEVRQEEILQQEEVVLDEALQDTQDV